MSPRSSLPQFAADKRYFVRPDICRAGVESSRVEDDRPLLEQAIQKARIRGGIVVAVSRDRFIRHRHFDGRNKTEMPTIAEYRQLHRMAGGVPLATLCDPDQPARSDQIKRGQAGHEGSLAAR